MLVEPARLARDLDPQQRPGSPVQDLRLEGQQRAARPASWSGRGPGRPPRPPGSSRTAGGRTRSGRGRWARCGEVTLPDVVATAADPRHRTAFTDWLACAVAGLEERAARAARAAGAEDGLGRPAPRRGHRRARPGLRRHLRARAGAPERADRSRRADPRRRARRAPRRGRSTATLRASRRWARSRGRAIPRCTSGGWHPTAVCGAVGAAVAAARLLGVRGPRRRRAPRAGAGERAAPRLRLRRQGPPGRRRGGRRRPRGPAGGGGRDRDRSLAAGPGGWEAGLRRHLGAPGERPAMAENWIKAYPCCLKTHAPIEAAEAGRPDRRRPGRSWSACIPAPARPRPTTTWRTASRRSSRSPTRWPSPSCTARPPSPPTSTRSIPGRASSPGTACGYAWTTPSPRPRRRSAWRARSSPASTPPSARRRARCRRSASPRRSRAWAPSGWRRWCRRATRAPASWPRAPSRPIPAASTRAA